MESGLEGRNNLAGSTGRISAVAVSMESGLEGRNNYMILPFSTFRKTYVSMESGLEGRNNSSTSRA